MATGWDLDGHTFIDDADDTSAAPRWIGVDGRWSQRPVDGAQPLPGRFALHGLVDAHCHLTLAAPSGGGGLPTAGDIALRDARWAQYHGSGVLLARDTGGVGGLTLDLARTDPAHLVAAGRFLSTPGRYFPGLFEPLDDDAVVDAALGEVAAGARWVKVVADFPDLTTPGSRPEPTFSAQTLARLVGAVHDAGARVAAHVTTAWAHEVVAAGVDSVEHGTALTPDLLGALADRGGAWTPTIGATLGPPDAPDGDPPGLPPERAAALRRHRAETRERWSHDLPAAVRAGVVVLTGSDVVGTVAGEVRWLVRLGAPPADALAAATSSARRYLGVPAAGPGAPADVVTYAADPREHPEVLAEPVAVVSGGVRLA